MGDTVRLIPPDGSAAREVPADQAQALIDCQWTPETDDQRAASTVDTARNDYYSSPQAKVATVVSGVARGVSGGATDAIARAVGGESARADLAGMRAANPHLAVASDIAGAALPTGIGALAGKAGKAAGGSSILGAARGAAVEGAILGAGQGVSDVALSEDPVTFEHAASVIGSETLFGGVTGGVIGGAGKAIEKGLRRAKVALDEYAAKGVSAADAAPKKELATEIQSLRSEMKEQKIWLATKDADVKAIKEVREVGKIALEADRSIDRMLRNPKALEQRPQRVLDGLQQQEHALEKLVGQGDNLRPIFAKDTSGARMAALDYAQVALEKNRALQAKIAELTAKPAAKAASTMTDALGASALGHAVGAMAGVPMLGPAVLAAKTIGGVMNKIGLHSAEGAARISKGLDTFIDVSSKVAPKARPLATKTLMQAAYAQPSGPAPTDMRSAYKARVAEVRSQVQPMPDGTARMRPEARAQIAEKLAPIRAVHPLLADRIETTKAREVEFLAHKAPRKPDVFASQLGPDTWEPSEMEMRTWARYVAAVGDPQGVIERLADGSVTPEDAEAMKAVYPEMYADIQQQLIERMGQLRKNLPYHRRLALSIFAGIAVDPALDPHVITQLQSAFTVEDVPEESPGPMPKPQFGSVKAQDATPAQERAG